VNHLPPRQRLGRVVRALARQLPAQLDGLLDHVRFAAGAGALARLGEPATLDAALAAVGDDEAAWLADRLLERWRLIGEPVFEPEAVLVAPAEAWVGREPVRVPIELIVDGADPGWEAIWDGATTAGDPARAVAIADPAAELVSVRAHVRARAGVARVALTAVAHIAIRRPSIAVRDDRRRFVVTDQKGRPGVGVTLRIGDTDHTTGPGGLVELTDPAPADAVLRVNSIRVTP
jgi:hypothetical protein